MDALVDVTTWRLETDRLMLRPWREEDLEDFYRYASVPGVGEMAGWAAHENREQSAAILKLFMDEKKDPGSGGEGHRPGHRLSGPGTYGTL